MSETVSLGWRVAGEQGWRPFGPASFIRLEPGRYEYAQAAPCEVQTCAVCGRQHERGALVACVEVTGPELMQWWTYCPEHAPVPVEVHSPEQMRLF
jgi:hypothetical protein